jgi:hypothetical protein
LPTAPVHLSQLACPILPKPTRAAQVGDFALQTLYAKI